MEKIIELPNNCATIEGKTDNLEKIRCKALKIEDAIYKTLFTKKFENRVKWEQANNKLIKAFIPGLIAHVFVKEGMEVKKGDEILILEAMKMNNIIKFPEDGTVKYVKISENQCITKGQVLVEME